MFKYKNIMNEVSVDKKLAKSLMDISAVLYVLMTLSHGHPDGILRYIAITAGSFPIRNCAPK